jgi:phosphoglycolate phosphatase
MAAASGRLRLAIFDCDGTLVDGQHGILAAMAQAHRTCGFAEPDPAAVRRLVGLPLPDAMLVLLPEGAPADHALLVETYKLAFREARLRGDHAEPLFPGIAQALDALEAQGLLLGIATGKSHRGLLATLERHGLRERFVTLQTADLGPGKPHPDMVLRALSETGVEAADAVVIGDTSYDMIMARRAGASALGVAWGYHDPAELAAAGAAEICGAASELPGAVARLLASVRETMGMRE